jgi:hypothetical protein
VHPLQGLSGGRSRRDLRCEQAGEEQPVPLLLLPGVRLGVVIKEIFHFSSRTNSKDALFQFLKSLKINHCISVALIVHCH